MTCFDDLPEEILQELFARLPRRSMACAKAVCKRWNRSLSDASLIYDLRCTKGMTEPWAYAVNSKFERSSREYTGIEVRGGEATPGLAPIHRPPASILDGVPPRLLFAATAGGDGRRIYVMGGRTPLLTAQNHRLNVFRDVHVYDAVENRWAEAAPMSGERYAFAAAAVAAETLAVAGGYDGHSRPLRSAELYDVRADIWVPIAPMRRLSGACRGSFVNGKFYVLMANHNNNRNNYAMEAYDPHTCCWTSVSATTADDNHVLRSLLHPSNTISAAASIVSPSFSHLSPIILNL